MRRTTRKVSGPALGRYLERFFAEEPGMPAETAEHLAMRARSSISSIRVRANAVAVPGEKAAALRSRAALAAKEQPSAPPRADVSAPPQPVANVSASAEHDVPPAEASFDAYAIGLVPTFQREGRDGLIGKLAAVSSVDNLRKMARAQQIVLPEAMRQGSVALADLRAAIADSVAKRIADRKAAAR